MYTGTFLHNLDAKGRLSIPSQLRRLFGASHDEPLYMLPGGEGCIQLFTAEVWSRRMEEVSKLNKNNPEIRKLVRLLFNRTHYDKMDPQYRIIIPQLLKKHARIETEVLIAGSDDRIELWNPLVYEQWENSGGKSFEELLSEYLTN